MTYFKHPLRLFTLAVMLVLVLPLLLQDGMFMDGQQYACVAKNFGTGEASFWFPKLSNTWNMAGSPYFLEHPPLIYALQGGFFSVFGESRFVERFYSLLMALLTAGLMVGLWRQLTDLKEFDWLPVLLWIIAPVAFWAFHHNVHENTMGLLTLAAVYAGLRSAKLGSLAWAIGCGLLIFAATLSKGVPALFPLVVIGCYWLSDRFFGKKGFRLSLGFGKTLGLTIAVLLTAALPYLLLFIFNDTAAESLSFHINERLLARIDSEPTVTNRFYTLERLFLELLPAIGLTLLVWLWGRSRGAGAKTSSRETAFCLLIGAAASLPLMLTGVQRGFYITPSLPYFALGLALIAAPRLKNLSVSVGLSKAVSLLSLGLIIGTIAFSAVNAELPKRDADVLADTYRYGETIPHGSTVAIESKMLEHWGFIFYMLRYFDFSTLATNEPEPALMRYYVIDPQTDFDPPEGYVPVFDEGVEARYRLYEWTAN